MISNLSCVIGFSGEKEDIYKMTWSKTRNYLSKIKILIILLSIVGFFLIIGFTYKQEVGLTPDSLNYISTTESLLSGKGYLKYTGGLYVKWPPLYPTVVAILSLGIFPVTEVMKYLNAFLFSTIICLVGFYSYQCFSNKNLSVLSSIFILFSFPFIQVFIYAWSEPLFIFMTLLFITTLTKFVKYARNSHLFFAGFFMSMATLTRYIGLILIVPLAVAILSLKENIKIKKKILTFLLFTFFSLLPIGAWMARNYFLVGTLLAKRMPAKFSFFENVNRYFKTI